MSRIIFVRHGQASFLEENYDQLSPLGKEQCRLLGAFWKEKGRTLDMAFSGILNRQQQSADSCLSGIEKDLDVNHHAGYNEHHGPGIVRHLYPELGYLSKKIPVERFDEARRQFYGSYFKHAIQWVNGELDERLPMIEPWKKFRRRFRDALHHTFESCPKSATVVVFTSGGPVGGAVGEALNLNDEQTVRLGWQVKNASFSEFLYSNGRFSLVSFNETPHLTEERLQTIV